MGWHGAAKSDITDTHSADGGGGDSTAGPRRGYDCSVNGVSDAVYQVQGSGKQLQGKGKLDKIRWLHAEDKLPLPRHQAYGTILVKVKRHRAGLNPKTGESVVVVRFELR